MKRLGLLLFQVLLALLQASRQVDSLETPWHAYSISEEVAPPKTIGNLLTDIRQFSRWNDTFRRSLSFNLVKSNKQLGRLLSVNRRADLALNGRLDREAVCDGLAACTDQLQYSVMAGSAFVTLVNLNLTVLDINDNPPVFVPADGHSVSILEPGIVGEVFRLRAASDRDSPANGVRPDGYQLVSGDGSVGRVFELVTGEDPPRIRLLQPLDRERQSVYALQLRAVDSGSPANTGTLSLTVSVLDDNDSPPVIQSGCSDVTRDEDTSVGSVLTRIDAKDADIGENARLVYSLTVGIERRGRDFSAADEAAYLATFELNSADGTLKLARQLDYESVTAFRLTVLVKDAGQRPLSAECSLRVLVKDVNDNKPTVTVYGIKGFASPVEITESDLPNRPFALMSVEDKDAGEAGQVTCVALQPDLQMRQQDAKSYVLSTSSVFDREKLAWKLWTVRCQDNGAPPQLTELLVNATILDQNDNPPKFNWSQDRINIQEGGPAGSFILSMPASDDDEGENSRISYWLEPPEIERFFRVLSNGTIVAASLLDRETQESYSFSIVAADNGTPRRSTSLSIFISLSDINDCAPTFDDLAKLHFTVSEGAQIGDLVGKVNATDRDAGQNGQLVYTPATEGNAAARAFRVERDGRIYVAQRLDREAQDRYFIRVVATDGGTPQLNGSATITITVEDINDNAPEIRWPSLMNHTASLSYLSRPNSIVCNIDAIDNDLDRNARLVFSLRQQGGADRGAKLFGVKPDSGGVFVRRRMAKSDIGRYELQVQVSDSGETSMTRTARLVLLVDDSPDPATASGLSASEMNFLLIVIICSVTFVLSCILMASIWHTRRRLGAAAGSNRLYSNGGGRPGGCGKSAAAAAIAGDDEASGEHQAKSPMAPGSGAADHLPLEALDGRLKMSHASLYSRSDCIVPLHHCHLHDFDSGAGLPVLASGPGTSRLVVGGHRGGGGEASAQSSESDSGRGTCFIDDDPFREHALGSLTICGPRGAAPSSVSAGGSGLSTFTMDKPRRDQQQPDSCGGSSTMRTPPRLTRNFVGYGGGGGVSEHLLNAGPYPTQQQQQQQQQQYQQRLCSESRLV
ncbi:hypothetical protein BOX15_Mlig018789g2 [Macrostomum lignano]|uniref:Cadherin domain-containing protein n=1 Tax=Macrostomum lignano TaxID=282301 RepID=A0A267GZ25_9PLAT|nr:hypothetical protein BOX15_Mlig018789g2 [Macrostomum lignano]